MPKEPTQFKTMGMGTTHKQQPISVKFPHDVDAILRDKSIISDRSTYVRSAVLRQLHDDGLIAEAGERPSVMDTEVNKRVEAAIASVLPTSPIKSRAAIAKAFKKLSAKLAAESAL